MTKPGKVPGGKCSCGKKATVFRNNGRRWEKWCATCSPFARYEILPELKR